MVRDRIKTLRLELGLTQDAAARRAGISVDTWRRAERSGRCSELSAAAIAKVMEVELDELRRETPDGNGQRKSRKRELMCRKCARPVGDTGLRLTLMDRRGNTLQVRAVDSEDESDSWQVASHPGHYCSLECLTRLAADNLYEFTTALPGPTIDLRVSDH